MKTLRPLQPGDTVAILAPAKSVSADRVNEYVRYLQQKGYRVIVGENTSDEYLTKLAGTDEQRIAALNDCFRSPEIRAILCITGGYGCTRIVGQLDYGALREHSKIISGFSDITALHMAIYAETGLPSLHSPVLESRSRTEYTDRVWWDYLTGNIPQGDVFGWPDDESYTGPETWRGGKAEGVLIGGNLSLVSALEGTPHAVPKDRDVILFLEDVGEYGYRIDLMLYQLQQAGSFERVRGLMLGQFTPRKKLELEEPHVLGEVLKTFCDSLRIPILANLPFGHVKNNHTLVHGAKVCLDADAQNFQYLETVFA